MTSGAQGQGPASMLPPSTRGALIVLGRLLVAASLVFLLVSAVRHVADLPRIRLDVGIVLAFLSAVAASLLANALGALAWNHLIPSPASGVGDRRTAKIPYRLAFSIWAKSNIAKYLPGNIFHYAGRLTLAANAGLPMGSVLVSMMLEAVLLCAAPLVLVASGLLSNAFTSQDLLQSLGWARGSRDYALAAAGAFVGGGLIAAFTFPRLRDRAIRDFAQVGLPGSALALGCYVTNFLAMGAAAGALLQSIWGSAGVEWYALASGYGLAFLIGYVVPGAPGGIGIREIVMVGLFSASLGAGPVLGLAIILRIASIIADVLSLAIAYCLRGEAK